MYSLLSFLIFIKKTKMEITENFYKEEKRSGWIVSEQAKKIWAKELELYSELERICKKYDIKYFAEGGTLLGAVRHEGFIPWDDDMDIAMLRDDYNKFCEVASSELSEPFFFQNNKTDNVNYLFSRIRNSNTAAVPVKGIPYTDYTNHGIFIDIFPLDSLPDNVEEQDKVFADIKSLKNALKSSLTSEERANAINNLEVYFNELNKRNDSSNYTIYGLPKSNCFIRPKSLYDESIMLPFEMIEIPVMKDYEDALNYHYGDWNIYVIGGSYHFLRTIDTEHSYNAYRNQEPIIDYNKTLEK